MFGISGARRCDKLFKMELDAIEEQGSILGTSKNP
jgi:hypothetical protein